MGTTTPNIGLYIPADGETNYGTAFANGMLNLDTHDHSGPPNKGVPLSASGLANGSVTREKLNANVLSPSGGLSFDINNAIQADGLLKAIYGLGSNGLVTRLSGSTAAARTLVSADPSIIFIDHGDGVAGNPTFSLPNTFYDTGTFTPTINTTNNDIGSVSYSIQSGSWQKIGKWILINFQVVFTNGGGTGNLVVLGLPFPSVANSWLSGYINSASLSPNQQTATYQVSVSNVFPYVFGPPTGQLAAPGSTYGFNMQFTGIYQWSA